MISIRNSMLVSSLLLAFMGCVQARDTVVNIPLADVLDMPEAKAKLRGGIKFYLAGAKTPKILKDFGNDVVNERTNAFNKSDEDACKWAILSGLIAFEKKAVRKGANSVVNIVSYYKKDEQKNAETIECHAGGIVAGAALKGTYAKVVR